LKTSPGENERIYELNELAPVQFKLYDRVLRSLASGLSQRQVAELHNISQARVSQLAKEMVEKHHLELISKSSIKVHSIGSDYDRYFQELTGTSSCTANLVKSPNQCSPHRYAEKFMVLGGPRYNRRRLKLNGWRYYPRPQWGKGGFVLVYIKGYTATWYKGPKKSTMMIHAPRVFIEQSTRAIHDWEEHVPSVIQNIANELIHRWGFELSIDREIVGTPEVGFPLTVTPELEEMTRLFGKSWKLMVDDETILWADFSGPDGNTTYWGRTQDGVIGEIEAKFPQALKILYAADNFPAMIKKIQGQNQTLEMLIEQNDKHLTIKDQLLRRIETIELKEIS